MDRGYLIAVMLVTILSPTKADFGLSAAAMSAAATAISAGTSMAGTTLSGLMNDGYLITCAIEVDNWSRFLLTDATVRIGGGVVSTPPLAVQPSKKEAMVARKYSGTATGSYGTVSWLVESNPPRRLVVMWSAPFDYNIHSNWMAVGLTAHNVTKHAPGDQWFDQMYYHGNSNQLRFERKEYWDNISPVSIQDGTFMVTGNMGSGHKAKVKVVFRPENEADLAAPIRALLALRK